MKKRFLFSVFCFQRPLMAASCSHPRRQRGFALVMVLGFVVLLTVIVLAFFSNALLQRQVADSSVNMTRASLFAQGAVDSIVGDLRQEIVAGSTNLSTNTSLFQVYFPLSPKNAVPALSGSSGTNGFENLVKRSSSSNAFYPGASLRAASSSTTNASINGRSISIARWNTPLLLPKADPNSIDPKPTNSFSPPDWILVDRGGNNPTSWNTGMRWSSNPNDSNTVVGRYAYTIYDEGGLLDMNAAGFPPGSSTNLISPKGSLACADLSAIPGMTTNAIVALVGWRNYVTSGAAGTFPSYSFSAASQTNYFKSAATNTLGFLKTGHHSLASGQGDHMFVSRQQLIQFFTQGVATTTAEKAALQNALQYLGTFSRDIEQPSFCPDPKRPKNTGAPLTGADGTPNGGNDAYDPSGQLQDLINPTLLALRDQTGRPVMKRRFPLSRLALMNDAHKTLLAGGTLSGDVAEKILDCFGLTWDSANARWNYNHGNASRIYRLSEIPAQRNGKAAEPDFFETLKAVINCDSLGKQHGGNDGNESPHRFFKPVNGEVGIDGSVNYQILQIGAALIDQYDEDSYPSRIHFDSREFYGIENVPYLAGWMSTWYRTRQLTAGDILPTFQPPAPAAGKNGFPYETATLLQPIIWNSHAPDTRPNPPDVPNEFKIIAGGASTGTVPISIHPNVRSTDATVASTFSDSAWWSGYDADPAPSAPKFPIANASNQPVSYIEAIIDPDVNFITFRTTSSGPAAFREPYRLHAPQDPAGSNTAADPAGIIESTDVEEGSFTRALGFYTGRCWTGPSNGDAGKKSYLNMGTLSKSLRLQMQYKNPYGTGPAYLDYDTDAYVYAGSSVSTPVNLAIVDSDDSINTNRGFKTGFRADPRNNRWGNPTMRTSPKWDPRISKPTGSATVTMFGSTLYYFPFPQSTTLGPANVGGNAAGLIYRLTGDNQGGVPNASGWKVNPGNGRQQVYSDLMVNLVKAPGLTIAASETSVLPGGKTFCTDPDGVLRRASGAYFKANSADGLTVEAGNNNSRPVILNRPFQSVAEMGYTFRGSAWKDIDFFTPESGDAALLDAFCLNELDAAPADVSVAGRVNLNTRQPAVLQALLQGVSKAEGGILSPAEAQNAALALVNWTSDTTSATASGILTKGPLRNRSELVGKWVSTEGASLNTTAVSAGGNGIRGELVPNLDGSLAFSGYSSMLTSGTVFAAAGDAAIKRRRESVLRALADSGNTRTWNLLIDLVAQVGRYPASATGLDKFTVEGEARYWVHVAIDRYSGEVVAKLLEPVSE